MRQDIDVEDLVSWTLNEQAAHKVVAMVARSIVPLSGGSSSATVCDTLALGAIVDRQGLHIRALGARCHPDALTVYDALTLHGRSFLSDEEISLILAYGKTRSRPDWEVWPEILPRRHPRNGRVVVEQDVDDRTGKVLASWCPLDVRPSLDIVIVTRATYSTWRGGLAKLRAFLDGELLTFRAIGPAAPHEPWANP